MPEFLFDNNGARRVEVHCAEVFCYFEARFGSILVLTTAGIVNVMPLIKRRLVRSVCWIGNDWLVTLRERLCAGRIGWVVFAMWEGFAALSRTKVSLSLLSSIWASNSAFCG